MFVGTPNLENKDMTSAITADLSEDWFNDIEIFDVDFDVRTLVNPA